MSTAEDWLQRWHDAHPGATSRSFLEGKDPEGRSSYQRLASSVRSGERVLDLACGDGYLLSLIAQRRPSYAAGIDLSAGELDAARERLGPDFPLHQGRAQELPFDDRCFDRITCHMALMLFGEVEQVLKELRRVLRPGGVFAAILSGDTPTEDNGWQLALEHLRGLPYRQDLQLGDRRTRQPDALSALFPQQQVRCEEFTLELKLTPEGLWDFIAESYNPALMVDVDQETLRARVLEGAQTLIRPDGTLPCRFGMRHLEVQF